MNNLVKWIKTRRNIRQSLAKTFYKKLAINWKKSEQIMMNAKDDEDFYNLLKANSVKRSSRRGHFV